MTNYKTKSVVIGRKKSEEKEKYNCIINLFETNNHNLKHNIEQTEDKLVIKTN